VIRTWPLITLLAFGAVTAGAMTPWLISGSAAGDSGQALQAAPPQPVGDPPADTSRPIDTRVKGVIAIGDAVMLTARDCLAERGISVHAKAIDDPEDLRLVAEEVSQDYTSVFIHLGHDAGLVDGQIERVGDAIRPDSTVVWATIQLPDPGWGGFTFEDRTNASIRNVVHRWPNARLLDWHELTARHPEWLSDGTSASPLGCTEYARRVAKLTEPGPRRSGKEKPR